MRSLWVLVAVLFAAPLVAQETYTINGTANQVAKFDQVREYTNGLTCAQYGLADSCTQQQATDAQCALENEDPGCTPVIKPVIYADSQAGREALVTSLAWGGYIMLRDDMALVDDAAECEGFEALDQATQDAQCVSWGRPAGCSGPCN